MVCPLKKRESIELVKILLDGKWHDTHYLALAAGKYIAPELASRKAKTGSVDTGRANIISGMCEGFFRYGRFEKRHDGRHCEWKLRDFEWAKKVLTWAGESLSSQPSIPEFKTITIPLAEYNLLSDVKQAYEKAIGENVTWEAFLVGLVGASLAGKLIRKGGESRGTFEGQGHSRED